MNIKHFNILIALLLVLSVIIIDHARAETQSDSAPQTCKTAECHSGFDSRKFIHGPVKKGECSPCHKAVTKVHPNEETTDFELTDERDEICYACHTDFAKKIKSELHLHTPVKQKDCAGCHDPHGAEYRKLLISNFSENNLFPFRLDEYALCFNCHNSEIVTEPLTDRLTKFRNGNINLHFKHAHFKHVNTFQKRGRNCKLCHRLHASNQSKHMRTADVNSGILNLPIKYQETETGGRCEVWCHKRKSYDRVNPVEYKHK